jgi:peptidoglycan/xylan/chitin deacetylase (PgdA/CDA1 family)
MRPNKIGVPRLLLVAFAVCAPLLSVALIHHHIAVALAPIFASHVLLLYATLVANSQWWGPVITRFETAKEEVWLTIDDGPSPAHTLRVLDALDRFDARATFFVIGRNAEKYPHLITEILARGHALANHSYTHPVAIFWCAGPQRIHQEIARCAETLRTTAERPNRFFRAPAGLKSPFLHPVLALREMTLIGWQARGFDAVARDAERVAARIEKHARPGAIVLLHEGHHVDRDSDLGVRCIELTLERLAGRGYSFVIPRAEQLRCSGGR